MASFCESIEDDLLVIGADDPRTVRLYRRDGDDADPPGADGGEPVTGAHRVMLASPPVTAAGAILPTDLARFHLQAKQLGYVIPYPGDVVEDVTDGGRRFTVDDAYETDNGTRYVLLTTAER